MRISPVTWWPVMNFNWAGRRQESTKNIYIYIYNYTSYNCIYHPTNKTLCCKEKITNSSAYTILNVQTLTFILTIPLQVFFKYETNLPPQGTPPKNPKNVPPFPPHLWCQTTTHRPKHGLKARRNHNTKAPDIFRNPWCLEWFSFWSLMMCIYDDM